MDSASKYTRIPIPPPEENNRSQFLIRVIIFSLRYYGCDVESISCVLDACGIDDTSAQVAQYIKSKKLIEHADEHFHPDNGTLTHRRGKGESLTTVTIGYAHGLPVKMKTECPLLPTSEIQKNVVVHAADGRQVTTTVYCRGCYCRVET